jgi:hypothetical protein
VVRLENWFVASGHFRYSNHPLVISPPLVGFVTQTREGYCQFFAGAMALMLRYLGIPARVAVGFAGGTYSAKAHAWLVTDREAHAWVEVWFKGYGWLPFDPTPAAPGAPLRIAPAGTLGGRSGPGSNLLRPGPAGRTKGGSSPASDALSRKNLAGPPGISSGASLHLGDSGGHRGWPALALLLVLTAVAVGIVLTKAGVRVLRRLQREPRRVAAVCRAELVAFLVDQHVEVPRSATLRELGELVQYEFGVDPAPFVAAVTAARYGRMEDAAAAVPMARRELATLLGGARRYLTRRARFRGLLSLRSLARPATAVDASASLGTGMVGYQGS